MPKRLYRLLLILLACALPLALARAADPAPPPKFQEDKDYARLPNPIPASIPGKAEVIEFFSYTCPHCNSLEPEAQEWLKRKPDNVVFVRVPVAFGPTWEPSARAYHAADAMGLVDKVHPLLFAAFHQEKRKLTSEDEIAAFLAEHGVDQDAFRKAYQSFQTETQFRRANQLAQRYNVRGVPMIIVNGQYNVRSYRMFEVVDFLLAQAR